MFDRPLTLRLSLATLAALASAGCGVSGDDAPAASVEPTPIDIAAAKARAATEATELAAEKPDAPTEPLHDAVVEQPADYTPPFPDRLDMFEAPKQAARQATPSEGGGADSVVLLGFANLDQPRVVLSIDQIVTPLSSGEEASGVRVISIAPPRAVLQRGRSRWTASIE